MLHDPPAPGGRGALHGGEEDPHRARFGSRARPGGRKRRTTTPLRGAQQPPLCTLSAHTPAHRAVGVQQPLHPAGKRAQILALPPPGKGARTDLESPAAAARKGRRAGPRQQRIFRFAGRERTPLPQKGTKGKGRLHAAHRPALPLRFDRLPRAGRRDRGDLSKRQS